MSKSELTKTEIKNLINKKVEDLIEKEVVRVLKTKKSEELIKDITLKTMVKFYKLMYMRSSFWSKDI